MDVRIIEHNSEEYQQMINLRLHVLLKPIGIPETYINWQKEKEDILIGTFESGEIIGCCVLSRVDKDVLQLRQMAVSQALQGKGIGAAIVSFAEEVAKENGYRTLMMHARDSVLSFYEKCGYMIDGKQFFEVNIPHHTMKKNLY